MRLSEAIRMGSLLVPKPRANDVTRCAIGMAMMAVGKMPENTRHPHYKVYNALLAEWPWLLDVDTRCPVCREQVGAEHIIWHIFDNHVMGLDPDPSHPRMTIEQLADFVASIEPQDVVTGEHTMENEQPVEAQQENPTPAEPITEQPTTDEGQTVSDAVGEHVEA